MSQRRLVQNFSLLGVYGKTEVVTGGWEAVHLLLHLVLLIGIEGAVVRKEKITDHGLFDFGDGLQTPGVEQLAIASVSDGDARVNV